jgi:hypothetical protein
METKFAILKICFLISITFFPVADAGEIYRWVDENGVTRFSDSPPDRNALIRSNAKSSPSFERKTSSAGPETSGIQKNDLSSQSRKTETAEGHGNSIGGSQNRNVNRYGKPDSIGQYSNHNSGAAFGSENTAGSDKYLKYDRSVPIDTNDVGTPNSAVKKPSRQTEEFNQKNRENNSKTTLENQQRRREIEEYNAKMQESNEKAAEVARKNQEIADYNAKVRKHNDQIQRQQYEDAKNKTQETIRNRNRSIDHGSVSTPYLENGYRTRR